MKELFKELKQKWMITALLTILLGLVMLIWPDVTIRLVCYFLGALAIVLGLARIVRYFKEDPVYPAFYQSDLLAGLIFVGVGIFLIAKGDTVINLIPRVFGIVLLANGIGDVQRARNASRAGYDRWAALMIMAFVTIAAGIVLLVNPFSTLKLAISIVGVMLIYAGLSDIIGLHVAGKKITAWKKTMGGQ